MAMLKQLVAGLLVCNTAVMAQKSAGFSIIERKDQKQVDILFNDKLLTAYCYYDSSRKPVLFPVNTIDGITVTRSYPFKTVPGERTDHPHHTGIWLNYESVNGLDFWNNSTAIAPEKRSLYGTIVHGKIISEEARGDKAFLTATAQWIRPDKMVLLDERTEYRFYIAEGDFIIDRITKLTAKDIPVVFKDVKDGMFAIRVARELEMPSNQESSFVDNKGNVTKMTSSGNDVTGMYYSSSGLKGDSVWSSQGTWVMLTGKKDGENITIGMFDHPDNVGYPAYWHARGYGLFAVNPLGRKVFSNGKEELNFTLKPGESNTFKYRIVIRSGKTLSAEDMNRIEDEFSRVK